MVQDLKRKRAEAPSKPRKKSVRSKASKEARRGPTVRGDCLKWKEVNVTMHLDDAEGFYGLEELSDVEVLQDENGKGLLFKPILNGKEDVVGGEAEADGDEWSGFSDDEPARLYEIESSRNSKAAIDREEDVADSKRSKKQRSAQQAPPDGLDEDPRFELLNGDANELDIDMSAWKKLDLSAHMLCALSTLKFSSPTHIQRVAIPSIVAGKDVIGKAVTGSGKTLAFGIPIIERWLESPDREGPIALILAPARELAHQISKHLSAVCEGLDQYPRLVTVTGGLSVLKQQRQLETADVVVGTPGRLWEVISESNELRERLKSIRFLVVDEADRLLSEGRFQEVEDIFDALDREEVDEEEDNENEAEDEMNAQTSARQTLVFSATFHKGLQQNLASRQKKRADKDSSLLSDKQSMEYLMHKLPFQNGEKPVFVDANPESQMAENLSEMILECKAMEKDLYLYTFLLQDQHRRKKLMQGATEKKAAGATARILVFTNSVSAVKRLVPLLQSFQLPSTSVSPLHSSMPQKSRLRSLERFSGAGTGTDGAPSTSVLVATDVAARGLDIKGITTIVHYHVPRTADTYVHRSGRTARVADSGSSILLCSPDETASVTKLIAKIHSHSTSNDDVSKTVDRMYLPNDLLRQVQQRVGLAQKLIEYTQSTDKVKNEDNWLRNAAEELGVEYDSGEFENAGKQGRRGRGGGKERKQKKAAEQENRQTKVAEWKARLKEDLERRIDFGDGMSKSMKYLAGGAFDVDKLLAERAQA